MRRGIFTLPSRTQWRRWSLPSKLTAIGAYVGVIALLLSIVLAVFSRFERLPLLTSAEKDEFASTVRTKAAAFYFDPIGAPLSSLAELEALKRRVEKNPRYERELPGETSLLYRFYAGAMLLQAMQWKTSFGPYLREAGTCLKKSRRLYQSIWEKPRERATYEFFVVTAGTTSDDLPMEELIRSLFSIFLLGSDEAQVQERAHPTIELLKTMAGSRSVRDLKFFLNFKGSAAKFNYDVLLSHLKLIVEGQGGRLTGPSVLPTGDGHTLITYTVSPVGKPEQALQWVVDAESGLIEPRNPYSSELHKVVSSGD